MADHTAGLENALLVLDPLESYSKHPFDDDETYKQGLASLLKDGLIDPSQPSNVHEEALRRTRVFYFNSKTGSQLTVDDVRKYELGRREPAQTEAGGHTTFNDSQTDGTRVLTFAELQTLIETGKVDQIPNNKTIPDALNTAAPSASTAPVRKKPWEA